MTEVSLTRRKHILERKVLLEGFAPENPVRIGARNFNMVASDNDKCLRERYAPTSVMKLK